MSSVLWRYLQNPFENATKNNTKLMNLLAKDHHDKLKEAATGDIRIAQLYQEFLPKYEAFKTVYVDLLTQQRTYQSYTATVEDLFTELTGTKIRQWDIKIQYHHEETSHTYRSLLANGRAPFQTGGYESRTREVKSLGDLLRRYNDLSALQQEVEAFGKQLEQARTEQQGMEGKMLQLTNELEQARQGLSVCMHSIFGYLIAYYAHNIDRVSSFYDLEYLRTPTSGTEKEEEEEKEDDDSISLLDLDDMDN